MKSCKSGTSKLIEPPPRCSMAASLIVLATVTIFVIQIFLQNTPNRWLLAGFPLLTVSALCIRAVQPFHLSLFCTLWVFLPIFIPSLAIWPLHKLAPLAIYASVAVAVTHLRSSIFWARPGRFDADIRKLVLLIVALSSAALFVWYLVFKPEMGPYLDNIPKLSPWLMPLVGIAFAMVNAAVEEAIFRGIFLQALDSALGTGITSVIIQAVVFGWMHFSKIGFPKGLAGVVMASVYGLLLGSIRYRARGMLAPWLAHAGSDFTVFVIVVTSISQ